MPKNTRVLPVTGHDAPISGFHGNVAEAPAARVRLWLTAAILSTGACGLQGQEALRDALTYDRITTPPAGEAVTPAASQTHYGPVRFSFGSHVGLEFNDNVGYNQSAPQADMIVDAGLDADLVWPATDQSELSLNAGIGYVRYLANPVYNRFQTTPDSSLTWRMTFDDGALAFFDTFTYSPAVNLQGAFAGVGKLTTLENSSGVRITWTPRQWDLEASYSHEIYFSQGSEAQYLDHASEYFFGRAGRSFAEATQAGVEGSASPTHYTQATQPGSTSCSLGPYFQWQITEATRVNARGGWTLYSFDSTSNSNQARRLNSYYAGLQVNHRLTPYFSEALDLERSVQLGLNQGSAYIEQLTAAASVNWLLTDWTTLGANLSYEHGTQPLTEAGFVGNEIYDRFGGGHTLAWQLATRVSTSIAFNHWLRQSSVADRNYSDNSLTFRLNWNF